MECEKGKAERAENRRMKIFEIAIIPFILLAAKAFLDTNQTTIEEKLQILLIVTLFYILLLNILFCCARFMPWYDYKNYNDYLSFYQDLQCVIDEI